MDSISQWLPCPLVIWNLLFGMAILLNYASNHGRHVEFECLNGAMLLESDGFSYHCIKIRLAIRSAQNNLLHYPFTS